MLGLVLVIIPFLYFKQLFVYLMFLCFFVIFLGFDGYGIFFYFLVQVLLRRFKFIFYHLLLSYRIIHQHRFNKCHFITFFQAILLIFFLNWIIMLFSNSWVHKNRFFAFLLSLITFIVFYVGNSGYDFVTSILMFLLGLFLLLSCSFCLGYIFVRFSLIFLRLII